MRIPTAIIVNDDNEELHELFTKIQGLVRTYHRTSLQGEQLYGIREGVLYFDDRGDKQLLHQDVYTDTLKQIQNKLAAISPQSKTLLNNYLERRTKKAE